MNLGPIEHEPRSPARKLPLDYFQRFNPDFRFLFPVYRVKVGRWVIVEVHSDHDSKKDAQGWHRAMILPK